MKKLGGKNNSANCTECSGELMKIQDLREINVTVKCPHCRAIERIKVVRGYFLDVEKYDTGV